MRVYVIWVLLLISALASKASADDDHEVTLVGDKNYTNKTVVYDGIDVSNYQKDINWEATARDDNIKYVYIKATEGATHRQHRYRKNLENARKHGIKVGSYHFMRTRSSIQSQFNNFISVVKAEEQDLVPLLDVETREGWTIKQLQDSVLKFARLLERHFGCKPMIYTSSSYFNNYLGETFAGYPLFIARYSKSEPQLYYGAKWILWQFSDRGRIEGIDAMVDLSRFNRGCGIKDIAYDKNRRGKRIKNAETSKSERDNNYVPRPKPRKVEEKLPVPPRQVVKKVLSKEEQEIQKRGEEAAQKRQKEEQKALEKQRKEEEKQRKEEEKQRKEIEKRQKEIEKRRAAEEQKRQAEEKKRLEQEKKRQAEEQKRIDLENKRRAAEEQKRLEQERKRQKEEAKEKARQSAQERMRAEKDRNAQYAQDKKSRDEQNRRNELEQIKQERQQREQQQAKQDKSNQQSRQDQLSAANQSSASTSSKTDSGKTTGRRVVKGNNQSSADNEAIHYNKKKKATQW